MLLQLLGKERRSGIIAALYGAIVAQARSVSFYRDYGVPDTVDGRFDMIALHVFLVFRRLRSEPSAAGIGQALFDHFCRDMDHNLREMGVSDVAVPRRMRAFGEAYYGRAKRYDQALAETGDTLMLALAYNIFGTEDVGEGARRLAAYVRAADRMLTAGRTGDLVAGTLAFPDPERIS